MIAGTLVTSTFVYLHNQLDVAYRIEDSITQLGELAAVVTVQAPDDDTEIVLISPDPDLLHMLADQLTRAAAQLRHHTTHP